VTLHFAYGSNMSRAAMRGRCPGARALGIATLTGWRFIIAAEGYASVAPSAGSAVHGVMWTLTPRDLAALNAYENIAGKLYARRMLRVECQDSRRSALVYIARRQADGIPRPGYLEVVVRAARDWQFPEAYIRILQSWSRSGLAGALRKDTGEVG
jgi:gamma-glutamylcyclotransferase (GGCT)/AIG2-like uncharacterized protein YtfP